MFISIDIDGVLARRNRKAYIQACNTLLNLSIAEEETEKLSYQDFLQMNFWIIRQRWHQRQKRQLRSIFHASNDIKTTTFL